MRFGQITAGLILLGWGVGTGAQAPAKKMTVTGKLTRVMAIGGESTGWALQFDSHSTVEQKSVDSIEVRFSDPKPAEKYANKRVQVTGTVTHREGVETGEKVILEVTSIKGAKAAKPTP